MIPVTPPDNHVLSDADVASLRPLDGASVSYELLFDGVLHAGVGRFNLVKASDSWVGRIRYANPTGAGLLQLPRLMANRWMTPTELLPHIRARFLSDEGALRIFAEGLRPINWLDSAIHQEEQAFLERLPGAQDYQNKALSPD